MGDEGVLLDMLEIYLLDNRVTGNRQVATQHRGCRGCVNFATRTTVSFAGIEGKCPGPRLHVSLGIAHVNAIPRRMVFAAAPAHRVRKTPLHQQVIMRMQICGELGPAFNFVIRVWVAGITQEHLPRHDKLPAADPPADRPRISRACSGSPAVLPLLLPAAPTDKDRR